MSVKCPDCGAIAGYGHEIGHKSDCPLTDFSKLRKLTSGEVSKERERYQKMDDAMNPGEIERRVTLDQQPAWDHHTNRSFEPVETLAEKIYDAFEYDGTVGSTKPKWTPGGNSTKQDEARQLARARLR